MWAMCTLVRALIKYKTSLRWIFDYEYCFKYPCIAMARLKTRESTGMLCSSIVLSKSGVVSNSMAHIARRTVKMIDLANWSIAAHAMILTQCLTAIGRRVDTRYLGSQARKCFQETIESQQPALKHRGKGEGENSKTNSRLRFFICSWEPSKSSNSTAALLNEKQVATFLKVTLCLKQTQYKTKLILCLQKADKEP